MNSVQFITCFIVVYLFWFITRWFVLPHLRIFPYIPPVWFWTTLYGVFVYIMNWLFLWIILYLIICYVSWVIIRRVIPNFPIPLKDIILDMEPWNSLSRARILQFIDKLVGVFVSLDTIDKRAYKAANAIADFLKSSYEYLRKEIGYRTGKSPTKPDPNKVMKPDNKYAYPVPPEPPKKKNTVRRSVKPSPFENDEQKQILDEYLQCVEENSVPVFPNMGVETAQAILKNRSASTICKLNMTKTYSNLMFNRV